ncbi:putative cobalt transporter subunit (CbtA) [Candidatus Nitrosomarinus catalina]|uniref:Putative cobalt transporter subunit (CbtA) n=1 Tax=Candidatus Nitrosomarinus catalinensis TaxID=1898749 RepID=A0A2Z2HK95_9ARCH|nr:CbtA family protein [Candidatus Nitrosomarinus catalina]ARS64482.1 putative cobalt transporter subunit (CbtA) [Candidatus Nitrosomarinus catalina]
MKTIVFILIVLISGGLAGLVHGTINFAIVEPYLDQAIGLENESLFASGEAEDTLEFWAEYESYRIWQKSGQVLAGVILGLAMGSLFGIVFALSRNSLPGKNIVTKAIFLSGLMWFTLYLIPFLKYPANPPTVGEADTVVLRMILYVSFIIISGIGVIVFYKLLTKLNKNKKYFALIGYAGLMTIAFIIMPDNPDEITAPMNLVNEFRFVSVLGVSSFWGSVGIILGLFWKKFDKTSNLEYS